MTAVTCDYAADRRRSIKENWIRLRLNSEQKRQILTPYRYAPQIFVGEVKSLILQKNVHFVFN